MLSRRHFLKRTGTALAASPVAATLLRMWSRHPDEFTVLRDGIGTFTQQGGTIGWCATDDALVVVDTQSPASASDCWAGLRSRTSHGLDLVINTHHHGDHVGGNGVFAEHTDRLVAHAAVPGLMRESTDEDETERLTFPTDTFQDEWSTSVGAETITLRHYDPAHTGGDAVVFFENANIVHVGDLVFNRAYPFIDVEGGADSQNWINTLETLHNTLTDDTLLIHGHGNQAYGVTGGREDLLVMRDFLSALHEHVARQREAGASLREVKETERLDGFEAFDFDWALSLADCIEAVYREQTAD